MEIALERNNLNLYKALPEQKTVCSLSADAVVPDTQQDILRILGADYAYRIRSKDIDLGKLVIRGELELNVSYVPDDAEGCSTIKLSVPFMADFGVSELDSSCEAVCSIQLASGDVIMLNPRKIAVSAGLEISVQCYKPSEIEWFSKPKETVPGLFFREISEEATIVRRISEKAFVYEDSYTPQRSSRPAKLLSAVHSYSVESTEQLSGKLVVRIRALTQLMYLDEQQKLFGESYSSVFSQLFELPELEGRAGCRVVIVPSGEYTELSEDKFHVELHAVAQLICGDSVQISYISDAYSVSDELALEYDEMQLPSPERLSEAADSIRLRYESDTPVSEIISVRSHSGRIECTQNGASVNVCADIEFCDKEGQLRSARIHGSYECDKSLCAVRVEECSAVSSGNDVDVLITLSLCSKTESDKSVKYICSMSAEECDSTQKRPSLVLRRIDSDDMWETAKAYKSDISLIRKLNGLQNGESAVGKLLMIPKLQK